LVSGADATGPLGEVVAMTALAQKRPVVPKKRPRAYVALGRAVRELRARRGLSQEALGFQSGLHRNYVGAIERGEINPSFRILIGLARGLRLPLSEIVSVTERHAAEMRAQDHDRAVGRG
jgi:DNA-binding XRE family transcriptional regulator